MQSSSSAKGDARRLPPRYSWRCESGTEAGALWREGEVFGLATDRKRPLHASLSPTEPHCNAGSGMSGPFLRVGVRSAKTWDCFIFDSNSHKRIGIAMTRTVNFTESNSQNQFATVRARILAQTYRAYLWSLSPYPVDTWCVWIVPPSVLSLIAA